MVRLLAIALCAWVGAAGAAPAPPDLAGVWFVADSDATVAGNRSNSTSLTILEVTAKKGPYYDGVFSWKWEGDPIPSTGYYSLQTGRVWFNTQRDLGARNVKVQYSGKLAAAREPMQIQGSAGGTGTERIEWHFTATKQPARRR
jgi:hypothetical protein